MVGFDVTVAFYLKGTPILKNKAKKKLDKGHASPVVKP